MSGRRGLLLAAVVLAACAQPKPLPPAAPPPPPPLRVGVTSDMPPLAARQGSQLVGIEVDFARALAQGLGRALVLVDLPRREQIPALVAGQIDIAMAALAAGEPGAPVAWSRPYLRSGLLLLVRRGDAWRYPAASRVLACRVRIGVVSGTVGEAFVGAHCPARLVPYATAHDAVSDLADGRIDALVAEAPVVAWFAAANEAELAPILDPLTTAALAWAMRPEDGALRAAVDDALARWATDGTRDRILTRWMPYWRRLEALLARGG